MRKESLSALFSCVYIISIILYSKIFVVYFLNHGRYKGLLGVILTISFKKNMAFTLAEVLITLGIIGIVAAITIPTLMQNTQDQEFRSGLKKEYSVLSQAHELLTTENGGSFTDALASGSGTGGLLLKNVFKQKLSYLQECATNDGSNLNVCFPASSRIKYLNGTSTGPAYLANDATVGLVLKDGTSLAFGGNTGGDTCTGTTGTPGYNNNCGYVIVDVNGTKPPNTWGRDIYMFFIFSDTIRPSSVLTILSSVANADDCNAGTNRGYTCSSKYMGSN